MEQTESTNNESFSFVDTEHKILKFWEENKIFQKSLEQTKDGAPYIFYDGPPFATGLPHHGHLVGGILKDAVPRYWTMKGRYVERRFGWDCHGLPIEHEIDKKLGMSAQDAVKKMGVAGYNQECRGIVSRYTKEWEKTVNRIGRWVDFENDYKTMDTDFMESVWWVFKQLWDKDLIYQGTRVVPFSTALGTVLSNFEAGQNYQDVQDPAITVLFKALEQEDGDDVYFAAWTTTPWTLPSNLGLCAGPDIDYVLLKDEDLGKKIYMAKALVPSYEKKRNYTILKEVKGTDLKGRKYEPLFSYFANMASEGAFQVHNDDYVTTDSGTGIVHTAPGFGEDDNRVMKEAGLGELMVCPVDDAGKYTKEIQDLAGTYVKDADKPLIKTLKDEGKLYEQSVYVHSYPFCYRSDTPLIYKAIPSWYVRVERIKERLINSNKQINWVPGHIKEGRFGKWLEGARDWSISRNRIWGTPLPVWYNQEEDKFVCMGSIEDLKNYCGDTLDDLHREFVDPIEFKVDGEKGSYKRITEVLDCWFESGSMPFAQLHYPFENKEMFEQGFPAEFIAEGLDQTRGWFYTLTILATALYDKPAFKNVIVNGIVMAEDGKKMSKRLKNYTAPDELMETFGADAMRLYLINSGLVRAEEMRFADTGVKDMVRRALLPWYNSFKFFTTYAKIDGWNEKENSQKSDNITDNWVISNLQTLKKNIATEMEAYRLYNVVPALFTFIEDLTNWYIRLNRARFWGDGLNDDKCAAYTTLHTCIKEVSVAMAPFAPFLSEHIYQELLEFTDKNSVPTSAHLCEYPTSQEDLIRPKLEEAVNRMQQLILLGRQKRTEEKIKVKTPLSRLTIIHKDQSLLDEIKKLEIYIQSELNIKTIEYDTNEDKYINLYAKPNLPVLGKRLGKEMGKFMGLIKKVTNDQLLELEEKGSLELGGEKFTPNDFLIFREAKEGTQAISNRFISIDLDCHLTDDLIEEGLARECVNRIQRTRKDLGFNVEDRISVVFNTDSDKLKKALELHKDYICGETLAVTLSEGDTKKNEQSFSVDSHNLKISIEKS
ncbi:MAG: isoleucine--tRNA ligase [Halobacteriovoraceae bacterium]|nr:isoleucine--tRNA ligase [Halobacteriovoraceae bacterium]